SRHSARTVVATILVSVRGPFSALGDSSVAGSFSASGTAANAVFSSCSDTVDHPRVDEAIGEVDEQVDHQYDGSRERDDTENRRNVTPEHGVDRQGAETLDTENCFDHHGAAEQLRDADSQYG